LFQTNTGIKNNAIFLLNNNENTKIKIVNSKPKIKNGINKKGNFANPLDM